MANEPDDGRGSGTATRHVLLDLFVRRWCRWTLLGIACAVVAFAQVRLNRRFESAQRAAADSFDWLLLTNRDATDKANAVRGDASFEVNYDAAPVAGADALRAIEAAGLIEISRTTDGRYRLVEDRATGGRTILVFDDEGRFYCAERPGQITVTFELQPPPPPREVIEAPNRRHGLFGAANLARRVAYHLGYVLFALLLLRLPSTGRGRSRPERRGMAVTLAEVAVVSLFLASIGLEYRRSWGILTDTWYDAGALGVIAVLIAAAVLVAFPEPPPPSRGADGQPACVRCGYDLTANESGVCPECGAAAVAAQQPA